MKCSSLFGKFIVCDCARTVANPHRVVVSATVIVLCADNRNSFYLFSPPSSTLTVLTNPPAIVRCNKCGNITSSN